MSRYTPRQSPEFEGRQLAFEFGEACRFVAELAASVKKTLCKYVSHFFKKMDLGSENQFPPEQLFLDLNFEGFPQ